MTKKKDFNATCSCLRWVCFVKFWNASRKCLWSSCEITGSRKNAKPNFCRAQHRKATNRQALKRRGFRLRWQCHCPLSFYPKSGISKLFQAWREMSTVKKGIQEGNCDILFNRFKVLFERFQSSIGVPWIGKWVNRIQKRKSVFIQLIGKQCRWLTRILKKIQSANGEEEETSSHASVTVPKKKSWISHLSHQLVQAHLT